MYSRHLFSLVLFSGLLLTTAANKCPIPDADDPDDMGPQCYCDHDPTKIACHNFENVEVLRKVFMDTGDHPFVNLKVSVSVLSYFPAYALKEKSMRGLFLEGVNLVGLFDRAPEPNHRLSSIYLQYCKVFRGIEWPLLRNLNNLTSLNIDSVTIRSLGKEFMDNVPRSLSELFLSKNKLSRLNDRVFARFTGLTNIALDKERITSLKRTMFPAENVIESLSFEGNQISELPDNIFSDMPKLMQLSLENNLFTTISETIFHEIGSRNIEIVLSGNNIKCDCNVRWILKTGMRFLRGKCHSPNQFKDKDLVDGISEEDFKYCDDV